MKNVWRFSLFLAFSSIIDQLVKGSIQSILDYEGMVKPVAGTWLLVARHGKSFFNFSFYPSLIGGNFNGISIFVLTLLCCFCLYRGIKFRNKGSILGWSYTFLLSGAFSSWLDRVSQGFVLKYIRLEVLGFSIATSIGEALFWGGLFMVSFLELKRMKT